MKHYLTIARKDLGIPKDVYAKVFIQGNFYKVSKTNDSGWVLVEGTFKNSLGGVEYISQAFSVSECKEFLIYVNGNEKEIYPKYVHCFTNGKKVYDLYMEHKNDSIGTQLTSHAGAPGIGYCIDVITKITDNGIFGVQIHNTMRVPDLDYYM